MTSLVRSAATLGLLASACVAGQRAAVPPAAPPTASTTAAALSVPAPSGPSVLRHRGVNLSGGEFGRTPGVYDRDYLYPGRFEVDYFADRGMNHLRIPFRHERLQPVLRADLDRVELGRLLTLVRYAVVDRKMTAMLDPHDSFRHKGRVVSEVEIGDLWGRVARELAADAAIGPLVEGRVQANLTNEPHDMATETVVRLDNAAIRELRRVGFRGLVIVPGNGWTGGWQWASSWYGTPNAVAMLGVTDPLAGEEKLAFDVHQYLDPNADGLGDECVSVDVGVERLSGLVRWLYENKRTAWLSEVAAPNTPTCREAIRRTLSFVEGHPDVWRGWDWWGAGVWSFAWTYNLSIGPTEPGAPEKPQMAWLRPFLSTAPPAPCPP